MAIDDFYRNMVSGIEADEPAVDIEPTEEVIDVEQGYQDNEVEQPADADNTVEPQAYTIPDFIGEEWRPPADADDSWYREKYSKFAEVLGSEDFVNTLTSSYADELMKTEEHLNEFRKLYQAYKGGDVNFLRMRFPEELSKIGISPVLSEEDIDGEIERTLKEEFGDNYADIYDVRQVVRPSSVSAKIFKRTTELSQHWNEENKRREQAHSSYKPQQQTEVPQLNLDAEYKAFEGEMTREDFDDMMVTIKEGINSQWTLKDLRRIVTYEDDIARAREEGIALGRKGMSADIQRAGKPVITSTPKKPIVNGELKRGATWNEILSNMMND